MKEFIFFLDTVTEYCKEIESILNKAHRDKLKITIFGIERNNEWNSYCDCLKDYLSNTYDVKYLSDDEIGKLCLLFKET